MNRTMIAAALICAAVAAPSWAAGSLPGIGGNVFEFGSDGPISGVNLQLFLDDGDGVFDAALDTMIGAGVASDADGAYCFDDLDADSNYFVQRPSQEILGIARPEDVSALLSPGEPLLIIDEFANQQMVSADPMNSAATSSLHDPMSSALGEERDLYVELVSGIGEVSLRSNAFGVDVLQYDTSSGVMGRGIVTWDGVDVSASPTPALGLGNVDLTVGGEATGLLFKLGVDLTGTGEELTLRLFQDSADEYSEASALIPVTDGTASALAFLPFDSFVGPVGADNVNAIQLIVGGASKSVDAQLDWVVSAGPATHDFVVVPEPTAALTALIGLLGMLRFRSGVADRSNEAL